MKGCVFCCVVFVSAASSCYGFCKVPYSLWCSSPEIAEECHVSSQCQEWTCLAQLDAKPVDVAVYYEPWCQDCHLLFLNQLEEAHIKVAELMNLQLVLYGNANANGSSKVFTCGIKDYNCTESILQACAIYLVRNISLQFPFISCLMSTGNPREKYIKKCASKIGEINTTEIMHCTRNGQGLELVHQMGLRTKALQLTHDSPLPWVTLNGVHFDYGKDIYETGLVSLICQKFQGILPYHCRMAKNNLEHPCHTA